MEITHSAVLAVTKFIAARERHRIGKEGGRAVDKPDPIISKYRFCNVRRNDDRVTKWIHATYLSEWGDNRDLWFALVVARLFNNEETLASIGLGKCVLPFKPEKMRGILKQRALDGKKNFNAAYIVSTNGRSMNKVDYLIECVLPPMWAARKNAALIVSQNSLEDVHTLLMTFDGMGSFMAAQVVADLKYAEPKRWADFDTFCASGPGSRRGLNYVCGRPVDTPWREDEFRATVLQLRDAVHRRLPAWEPLTAQDVQNCLCEYSKYTKVVRGIGEPKQLYRPHEKES